MRLDVDQIDWQCEEIKEHNWTCVSLLFRSWSNWWVCSTHASLSPSHHLLLYVGGFLHFLLWLAHNQHCFLILSPSPFFMVDWFPGFVLIKLNSFSLARFSFSLRLGPPLREAGRSLAAHTWLLIGAFQSPQGEFPVFSSPAKPATLSFSSSRRGRCAVIAADFFFGAKRNKHDDKKMH